MQKNTESSLKTGKKLSIIVSVLELAECLGISERMMIMKISNKK